VPWRAQPPRAATPRKLASKEYRDAVINSVWKPECKRRVGPSSPDEPDAGFAGTCEAILAALPNLWRDRWWRVYDRDPPTTPRIDWPYR
jgi:hypothetical protein